MVTTLRQWLQEWQPVTEQGHLLGYRGRPLVKLRSLFKIIAKRAGIVATPYTIRHTLSTWITSRVSSHWERDQFMGWLRSEGSAMGANYNHYDPRYLREVASAVQELFEAIAPHMVGDLLKRGFEDQPLPDAAWEAAPSLAVPPIENAITLLPLREKAVCNSEDRDAAALSMPTLSITYNRVATPGAWQARGTRLGEMSYAVANPMIFMERETRLELATPTLARCDRDDDDRLKNVLKSNN